MKINMTYTMGLIPIEHKGYKYNFLDTPGYFDFHGEVVSALTIKWSCYSYRCTTL